MKKTTNVFSVAIIAMAIIFGFVSCGDDGGGNPPVHGSITFNNLPENYSFYMCRISNITNVEWVIVGLDIKEPDTTEYRLSLFAGGFRGSDHPKNKGYVWDAKLNPDGLGEPSDNDFTYNGFASVYAFFYDSDSINPTRPESFGFNNVQFNNGHATIDFAASSFTLPQTDGEFTLTNASDYNDKYAILVGMYGEMTSPTVLYGFKDATSISALKGYQIKNGTVKIPVFKLDFGATKFSSYSGNDTATSLMLLLMDTENFDYLDYSANIANYRYLLYSSVGSNSVSFSAGKATADAEEGTKTGW